MLTKRNSAIHWIVIYSVMTISVAPVISLQSYWSSSIADAIILGVRVTVAVVCSIVPDYNTSTLNHSATLPFLSSEFM